MTLIELLGYGGGSTFIVILLSLIKVKPLEISVWHWIARKLGRAFNGEVFDEVKEVKDALKSHLEEHEQAKADRDEDRAETFRQRILRFSDEMYDGKYHSRESFENIIEIIDQYDRYCKTHPEFPNGMTIAATKLIRDQYEDCMRNHSFEKKGN